MPTAPATGPCSATTRHTPATTPTRLSSSHPLRLKWSYAIAAQVNALPVVASGVAYIGSFDARLHALDAGTGALKWVYNAGAAVYSSPAVANGVVYGLDADTGAIRWSYATQWTVSSSPAAANGVVYVGSDDAKLYAFESASPTSVTLSGFAARSASVEWPSTVALLGVFAATVGVALAGRKRP